MDIKKKKLILALFIIFLMVTSIAGFISLPNENPDANNFETKVVNGLEFTNINNKWVIFINDNAISLSFDPETLDKQRIVDIKQFNSGEKIYFSTDQNETNFLIYQELNVLAQLLAPKTINSCYEDNEKCKSLPLKNCNSAKDLNKVVIIKKEKNQSITYSNNCLEMAGPEAEIIKFIDQLILSLIG